MTVVEAAVAGENGTAQFVADGSIGSGLESARAESLLPGSPDRTVTVPVLTLPTAGTAPTADGPFGGGGSSKSLGGPGNVCGTPAIVVPTGLTKDRLPTAIQLDGRAYSENRLIALAVAYQNATAWHLEHPDVS